MSSNNISYCNSLFSFSICDFAIIQDKMIQIYGNLTFVIPPLSPIGLIFNFLILIFMPFCKGVPPKARAYYLSIAIFDTLSIIFLHSMVLSPVMIAIFSNYQIKLPLFESFSDLTCQISRFIWRSAQACSATLSLSFAVERVTVTKFPFFGRKITISKTIWIIIGVIGFDVGLGVSAFQSFSLGRPAYGYSPYCSPKTETVHRILNLMFDIFTFIVPNFSLLVLTIFLMIMIKGRRRNLIRISGTVSLQPSFMRSNQAELNTIMILICIASIQCIIFIPFGFFFMYYTILDSGIALIFRYFSAMFNALSIFHHSSNFLIYMIRLKAFRNIIFCQRNANLYPALHKRNFVKTGMKSGKSRKNRKRQTDIV